MTLDELITKYAGLIHRQTATELKGNPVFMKHCRENKDFKAYVLDRKPTMATVKIPRVEFLDLDRPSVESVEKSPQIEPEPLPELAEEVPKALQLYRDVVKHSKFL